MKNEMRNDEAVSPVIATILMVAITVVLAGVLYVWANELASNQTDAGTLNSYKAEDHPSATTTGGDNTDSLIRMSFTNGPDDLQWSFLTITLFDEEDAQTYSCTTGGADCNVVDDGSTAFEGSEIVTLAEGGGADICSKAGNGEADGASCEVKVTIMYDGTPISGTSGMFDVI